MLGRNLERVDMTARLLSARYAETWGPTVLGHDAAVLLRRTRRTCAPTGTASTRRRRSSSCCSTGCSRGRCCTRSPPRRRALGELDPRAGRTGVDDEARRILGRSHAELSFLRVGDAAADLPELLERLQAATGEVHTRGHPPLLPGHPGDRVERA